MAQKKQGTAKSKDTAKETGKETKQVKDSKKDAPKDDAKAQKRKARMEALKERPAVQRPNSRQFDVIDLPTGQVLYYGNPVKKMGTLITTVLTDAKGNPISVTTSFLPGSKVKVKKNHGIIIPGVAGSKKGGEAEEADEEED